jgi:hypothetical protein
MAAGVVLFSIIYNIPRWMEMRTIRKECLESSYPFGAIVYEMKTAPLRQNPEYKAYYIFWGYFFLINVIPFASLIFFNFKIFQAVCVQSYETSLAILNLNPDRISIKVSFSGTHSQQNSKNAHIKPKERNIFCNDATDHCGCVFALERRLLCFRCSLVYGNFLP